MRKLEASDVRDLHLLKHYRIIRQWACKNNGLNSADLELLIYLDCVGLFNRLDFIDGSYSYSWDTRRWSKLKQNGWITLFSARNRTTVKSNIYKVSFKGKQLISRIYRIMLQNIICESLWLLVVETQLYKCYEFLLFGAC